MSEFELSESQHNDFADAFSFLIGAVESAYKALVWTNQEEFVDDSVEDGGVDNTVDESVVFTLTLRLADFVALPGVWSRILEKELTPDDVGHNFVLSADGHGTGFWDRGWGEAGEYLHEHAKGMGVQVFGANGFVYGD